jgi:hypothetical protein
MSSRGVRSDSLHSYCGLYSSCPVCLKSGDLSEVRRWYHDSHCGGVCHVRDDAQLVVRWISRASLLMPPPNYACAVRCMWRRGCNHRYAVVMSGAHRVQIGAHQQHPHCSMVRAHLASPDTPIEQPLSDHCDVEGGLLTSARTRRSRSIYGTSLRRSRPGPCQGLRYRLCSCSLPAAAARSFKCSCCKPGPSHSCRV